MSSCTTNLILSGAPVAAAGLSASTAEHIPFEWAAAIQVLAGVALLLALIANGVNIWKITRPVPPVGDQIKNAIREHEAKSEGVLLDCRAGMQKEFERTERRLDAHERCISSLERSVATLEERTRRN
jgi:hypothetical protein